MDAEVAAHPSSHLYHPLTKPSEIRLLTLLSGQKDSVIQCEVHPVLLDHTPEYEALSYVLGDAKDTVQILLNQESFPIARNLHTALCHLRYEEPVQNRILWADAVCIDQNNIPERNQQVSEMWRVYKSAKHVLAWRGHECDDSHEAMLLIPEIATFMHSRTNRLSGGYCINYTGAEFGSSRSYIFQSPLSKTSK
jgi:hypothetical protein